MHSIISVSGFGYCGTTAVVDLLRSFKDEIEVTEDIEYQILYFPDGIGDLDYKLNTTFNRFYDGDVAIVRFLNYCRNFEFYYPKAFHGHLLQYAEDYVAQLVSTTWNASWTYDRLTTDKRDVVSFREHEAKILSFNNRMHFINKCLRKMRLAPVVLTNSRQCYQNRKIYLCILPEDFLDKTHEFINKTLKELSSESRRYTLLRQFLPPGNPTRYYKYLPFPAKTIVVTRDPRDLYVLAVQKNVLFIPHENVGQYIIWYRENHKEQCIEKNNDVLRIQFEDMIYGYEETVLQICDYLKLEPNKVSNVYFNPDISKNNTQLYLKYPQYGEDVEMISRELSQFLYAFK